MGRKRTETVNGMTVPRYGSPPGRHHRLGERAPRVVFEVCGKTFRTNRGERMNQECTRSAIPEQEMMQHSLLRSSENRRCV